MAYTIGEIAKRFNISISTIRYYDKEGLLPNIKRENGIRKFSEQDVETIFIIECLKKTNVELKDIKRFITMVKQGDSTIDARLNFFKEQKEKTLNKIKELEKALQMLEYKEWYYTKAQELGSTKELEKNIDLYRPEEMKKLFNSAHEQQ